MEKSLTVKTQERFFTVENSLPYLFENPLLHCKCIRGKCNDRKGCGKAILPNSTISKLETRHHETDWNKGRENDHMENRAKILRVKLASPINNAMRDRINKLSLQDGFFPLVRFHIQRELVFKAEGKTRRQRQISKHKKSSRELTNLLWEQIKREVARDRV